MASFLYQAGVDALLTSYNAETATIKAMLVTSGYTANKDHDIVNDTTPGSNELNGTGYTRKTLSTVAVAKDDTNDRVTFDADDITWSAINAGTAAACVIYIEVTDDTDSILLAHIDDGGFPIVTSGADMTISWDSAGVFYIG